MDASERRRRTEELEIDSRERQSAKQLHRIIIGFALVVLAALVTSIQLSTLSLSSATELYGAPTRHPGQPSYFRALALEGSSESLIPAVVEGKIILAGTAGETAAFGGRGIVELHFLPPTAGGNSVAASETQATLELTIKTTAGKERADFDLRAAFNPPTLKLIPLSESLARNSTIRKRGPVSLHLYPLTLEATRGLKSRFIGLLSRTGQPYAGQLEPQFHPLTFLSATVERSAAGVSATPYATFFLLQQRQALTPTPLAFSIGAPSDKTVDEEWSAAIPVDFRGHQLALEVFVTDGTTTSRPGSTASTPGAWPDALIFAGQTVRLRVHTLPFSEAVFFDGWIGNRLFFTAARPPVNGVVEVDVTLPRGEPGLVRFEAYRTLWDVKGSLSQRNFWLAGSRLHGDGAAEQRREALVAATDFLERMRDKDGVDEPSIRWARQAPPRAMEWLTVMGLSRIASAAPGMPLLGSTLHARRNKVAEFVASQRGRVHGFLGLTVLVFVILLGIRLRREQRRRSTGLLAVLSDAAAAGVLDTAEHHTGDLARTAEARFNLAMALFSIALLAYGLWMLLSVISWQPEVNTDW